MISDKEHQLNDVGNIARWSQMGSFDGWSSKDKLLVGKGLWPLRLSPCGRRSSPVYPFVASTLANKPREEKFI